MIIHWHFDPILLSLGPLQIHWYGLLFVGGFVVGQIILGRLFVAEGVDKNQVEPLMMYGLLGTVVGARLVHCLFYDPGFYLTHPLEILYIWKGGLASHGGVIGLLTGLWLCSRKIEPKMSYLWLLDRVAIPAALAAAFIRVANFLNSEIVGEPTGGNWGVVFEAIDRLPRHPAQLYEAVAYLIVFVVLLSIYRRFKVATPLGLLTGALLTLIFSARIAVEFVKTPQAAYEAGQMFSVGQYLSLPFVAVGVGMVVWAWRRGRPGNASS